MTWHLRIWRPHVPTILSFPFPGQKGKPPCCIWGDALTLDNSLWNTRIEFIPGCFLTSFNLCISNFVGLHFASFPAVQCYWFQWDFSMCWSAGRGAAQLDFSDQGQLHLRSLTLCSLSSATLLITAHVFPAECKGVTVSLEDDACVVMGKLWCSILKGFYHETAKLCSARFDFQQHI